MFVKLLWLTAGVVGTFGFMNILRPPGGCGFGQCRPPQIPFIPQRPTNCGIGPGQIPCRPPTNCCPSPVNCGQGQVQCPPPVNCGQGQFPCPPPMNCGQGQFPCPPPVNCGSGQTPCPPPPVPGVQHGSHYSKTPVPAPVPATLPACVSTTHDGVCAVECDVGNYTSETTDYKCGTVNAKCCIQP